jgi:hypothetical protein
MRIQKSLTRQPGILGGKRKGKVSAGVHACGAIVARGVAQRMI